VGEDGIAGSKVHVQLGIFGPDPNYVSFDNKSTAISLRLQNIQLQPKIHFQKRQTRAIATLSISGIL